MQLTPITVKFSVYQVHPTIIFGKLDETKDVSETNGEKSNEYMSLESFVCFRTIYSHFHVLNLKYNFSDTHS